MVIESPQIQREREIRERQLELKEQELAARIAKVQPPPPKKEDSQFPNPLLAARLYGLGILDTKTVESITHIKKSAYDKLKANKPIIGDIERAYSMAEQVDIRDILKYRLLEVAMFTEDICDLEDIKGILGLVVGKPSQSSKIDDNIGGGIEGQLIDAAQ